MPSLLFGLAEDMNLLAPEIASTFCCWPHAAAADRAANSCCTMAELRLDMAGRVGASTVVCCCNLESQLAYTLLQAHNKQHEQIVEC